MNNLKIIERLLEEKINVFLEVKNKDGKDYLINCGNEEAVNLIDRYVLKDNLTEKIALEDNSKFKSKI